jgi:hypothetical protein
MAQPNPPVTLPNVYAVIFEMENIAIPAQKWRNTYDIFSSTTPAATDQILNDLASYQIRMTWSDSIVVGMKVYRWVRGAPPYPNGLPLFSTAMNTTGMAPTAWVANAGDIAAGGEVCLSVERLHGGQGKVGRLFHRSIPRQPDLQATSGGKWFIGVGSPFTVTQYQSIMTPYLNEYFVTGTSAQKLVIVQYSPKHQTVSGYQVATNFVMVGVTTNKQGRKNKK